MRTTIALLVCGWTAALCGVTFQAKSQHHAMTIDVLSPGNYAIRVTDTGSGEVLFDQVVAPVGARPAEISVDTRNGHIVVTVGQVNEMLIANVEVERNGMLTDSIHTAWALAPRRAHIREPEAYRVGGDVKAPVLVHRVEPKYTDEARKARISGIVIVEALIDKTGAVARVEVLKPLPFGLSESALDAVKQWMFRPATLNGKPVDVFFAVTVNFSLDLPPPSPP